MKMETLTLSEQEEVRVRLLTMLREPKAQEGETNSGLHGVVEGYWEPSVLDMTSNLKGKKPFKDFNDTMIWGCLWIKQ